MNASHFGHLKGSKSYLNNIHMRNVKIFSHVKICTQGKIHKLSEDELIWIIDSFRPALPKSGVAP